MTKAKLALLVMLLLVAAAITGWGSPSGGTSLSSTLTATTACLSGGGGANVGIAYTITSTAAADAATVTWEGSGSNNYSNSGTLPTILAGNVDDGGGWTFSGSTKTASGELDLTLANGTYTFTICATQDGSGGNPNKVTCSDITVTVNCAVSSFCPVTEVFGELIGNKNICKNVAPQIQFKGDFGATATLNISSSGYNQTVSVDRAGDSCVYHFNWGQYSPQPPAGAATYTFTVTGNSNSLVFVDNLTCSRR